MRPPSLVQIRASAGSGKTYELTMRYMAILASLRPSAISAKGVLAITFTNAAADEMRGRVIRRLKATALGEGKTDMDVQTAAGWLAIFLEDASALNIRTIDSLLHQIIRASALDLGISPDYQTAFSTKEALNPYVELFMEEASGNREVQTLLRGACHALAEESQTDSFSGGGKILENLYQITRLALLGKLEHIASQAQITDIESAARQSFRDAADGLLALAPPEKHNWNKNALKAVKGYSSGERYKDSVYCDKRSASELFNKKADIPRGLESLYARFRAAAQFYFQTREMLAQARIWTACVELARRISDLFQADMARSGILPQDLAPQKAKSVLSPLGAVSDAFCRMGNRLNHILVDEFQDTSSEQWAVLQALALESLSRGGSLLWVGDPKQSIYGWRGGNPDLFDAVAEDRELRAIAGMSVPVKLGKNWRSGIEIVNHTNKLFGSLANRDNATEILRSMLSSNTDASAINQASERIAAAYRDVNQYCQSTAHAYVSVEDIEAPSADELQKQVLDRLCQLLLEEIKPRRKWADVLILTRGNDFAKAAAEKLGVAGIPALTENGLLLNENALILQIIAFLTFLNNPSDDIAFWAVVTGSLLAGHPEAAELADADLASIAASRRVHSLWQAFAYAFPDIWGKFLAPFYNHASILTAYDTVMEWCARLDIPSRFQDDTTMLRRFLETVYMAGNEGMSSIAAFLEYWKSNSDREKAPMPENMNAVRIMTIHKAKGLQAPVVIVPYTNFTIKPSDKPRVFSIQNQNIVAKFRKDMGVLYHNEMTRQALEALNLLYVAMTRPVEELYVFKTSTPRAKSNNTAPAIDKMAEMASFAAPFPHGNKPKGEVSKEKEFAEKSQANQIQNNKKWPREWRPMQWLPRLKIFRNHARTSELAPNERGTLLHAALENLVLESNSSAACETALLAGQRATGIIAPAQAVPDLIKAVSWFASIPKASHWLRHGMPEHTFMGADGKSIRADLIVPLPGGPLAIDYKSGKTDAKHTAQMQKYLAALKESGQFSGKPVGLLIYLDLQKFQEITLDNEFPLSEQLPAHLA